ncbi:four helix bundle protein [Lacibacter sp. MH-610]|uniref:four helix bundle protein n=1 Tax=Lacibacter sp. MH-610 TaxID=3020883 RepID=UPI003891A226
MYNLDDLEVYNLSQTYSDKIWFIVEKWDPFPKNGLGRQWTDAADSISSNISEGYGRFFIKENIKFCFYSRGSILENKNWLRKAKNRNLISSSQHDELIEDLQVIHKKLNGYLKVLRTNLRNTEINRKSKNQ